MLGQQAILLRWGTSLPLRSPAVRPARALANQINRAVNDPPGLSADQRLELARMLLADTSAVPMRQTEEAKAQRIESTPGRWSRRRRR